MQACCSFITAGRCCSGNNAGRRSLLGKRVMKTVNLAFQIKSSRLYQKVEESIEGQRKELYQSGKLWLT